MPLNDDTKEKIRNVYLRSYEDLPVAKDLPRLAKFIAISDEEGRILPFTEDEKLKSSSFLVENTLPIHVKIFLHIRRVLLTLTTALEGDEKAKEVDKLLTPNLQAGENFFLPEVLGKFLITTWGEESKVLKVLKCVNQVR
jgi:hypothetical protein